MLDALYLVLGVILLAAGGEALIRGALSTANRLNISPLLSGLLIVGFGTSAPELVVSVDAAMNNQPDIALGNVIGSNIGNILLILGLCALITPLQVRPLILRRDASVVVLSSVLFLVLAFDSFVSFIDACVLLMCLLVYLFWAYRSEKSSEVVIASLHEEEAKEISKLPKTVFAMSIAILFGLGLLVIGSQVLLKGAIGIANVLSVPEAVIGLTLVAIGTSLPELTISIIAAIRKHADVAIGNILGSNIFNLLGILGISALLQPLPVTMRIQIFDQWVMLGVSVLVLLFLYTGLRVNRTEGIILLLLYILYCILGFFWID